MTFLKKPLSLIDMDIGLFISYELTAEELIIKLFRFIRLNTTPLADVLDFKVADQQDVTKLNRLNWFSFMRSRRTLSPVYTFQAAENRPRIFMRLDRGSHFDMRKCLKGEDDG